MGAGVGLGLAWAIFPFESGFEVFEFFGVGVALSAMVCSAVGPFFDPASAVRAVVDDGVGDAAGVVEARDTLGAPSGVDDLATCGVGEGVAFAAAARSARFPFLGAGEEACAWAFAIAECSARAPFFGAGDKACACACAGAGDVAGPETAGVAAAATCATLDPVSEEEAFATRGVGEGVAGDVCAAASASPLFLGVGEEARAWAGEGLGAGLAGAEVRVSAIAFSVSGFFGLDVSLVGASMGRKRRLRDSAKRFLIEAGDGEGAGAGAAGCAAACEPIRDFRNSSFLAASPAAFAFGLAVDVTTVCPSERRPVKQTPAESRKQKKNRPNDGCFIRGIAPLYNTRGRKRKG
jgi:hypothetical protein